MSNFGNSSITSKPGLHSVLLLFSTYQVVLEYALHFQPSQPLFIKCVRPKLSTSSIAGTSCNDKARLPKHSPTERICYKLCFTNPPTHTSIPSIPNRSLLTLQLFLPLLYPPSSSSSLFFILPLLYPPQQQCQPFQRSLGILHPPPTVQIYRFFLRL